MCAHTPPPPHPRTYPLSSLSTQDAHPPKDTSVKVRVLRDAGSLALSSSLKVELVRGSVHSVQAAEAEPLIRLGVLQCIDANG